MDKKIVYETDSVNSISIEHIVESEEVVIKDGDRTEIIIMLDRDEIGIIIEALQDIQKETKC